MKKIDLRKILCSIYGCKNIKELEGYLGKDSSIIMITGAMKEACNQAIDLCAENARTGEDINSYTGNTGSEYPADIIVNKQSILKTKNQII